ncbi:hypothetical protein EEB13_05405 [Rhodococcus sp. WS3]|uniref:YqaJ viral recombinase family protein n=1 Tax=Rhodococcus sp. WS3 TaxID=2486271 RepID=UPI00114371A9|nr:YqaJ viral recombinase family protein [Rhodococcus sp. WS3]ROZ49362.1 hypothetical protein EEB13_05405 [Rhodococcus sp. WS3]
MTAREVTKADKAEPGSPEWLKLVTASKIPSILGISRFKSQFALWHEMAGNVPSEPISESRQDDFDYGHAVELAAAEYWRYKNDGWVISRGEVQYTDDALEFGNAATIDGRASRGAWRRIVEIKTARDLEEWGDDGSGEVPADYAAQVIWQQLITGWHEPANIVLWPQYGKPKIYSIEYDAQIAASILTLVREWNASLASGIPPELDDSITTYETVRRLHPEIDGREVQLDAALAHDYLTAVTDDKEITKRLRGLKTRVLDAMGNAQTAVVVDLKIATRSPARGDAIALRSNTKADPATIEGISA